jgi:hypothetical protein
MAEIILTFEWDGKTVRNEVKGFKGKKCLANTKFIEDALGTPSNRRFKSEYYVLKEKETQKEQHRN